MPLAELGCEWVMWSGTLGRGPLEERAEAARAAGYGLLSVGAAEALGWAASGVSLTALAERVADRGVALHSLDTVVSWTDAATDHGAAARLLDVAAALGVSSITAVTAEPSGVDLEVLLSGFARFCSDAAGRGVGVDLEFVPMSAVPDVATAAAVLDAVDVPGVGVVFDTWHFFRGSPDLAAAVRAAPLIRQVQISDASWAVQGSLFRDTLRHRRLPGRGEFPLEVVLGVLHEHHALRGVGPEVLSSELHGEGAAAAALGAAAAVDELLERVLRPPAT